MHVMFGLMAVAFPGHMWRPLLQRAISRELWKLARADGKLPLHFFARSSKLGASLSEFFFFCETYYFICIHFYRDNTAKNEPWDTHVICMCGSSSPSWRSSLRSLAVAWQPHTYVCMNECNDDDRNNDDCGRFS